MAYVEGGWEEEGVENGVDMFFRKERRQACERVGMCVLASAVGDWVMGRKSLVDLTSWSWGEQWHHRAALLRTYVVQYQRPINGLHEKLQDTGREAQRLKRCFLNRV